MYKQKGLSIGKYLKKSKGAEVYSKTLMNSKKTSHFYQTNHSIRPI